MNNTPGPDNPHHAEPMASFVRWLEKEGLEEEFYAAADHGSEIVRRYGQDCDGRRQTLSLEMETT